MRTVITLATSWGELQLFSNEASARKGQSMFSKVGETCLLFCIVKARRKELGTGEYEHLSLPKGIRMDKSLWLSP